MVREKKSFSQNNISTYLRIHTHLSCPKMAYPAAVCTNNVNYLVSISSMFMPRKQNTPPAERAERSTVISTIEAAVSCRADLKLSKSGYGVHQNLKVPTKKAFGGKRKKK